MLLLFFAPKRPREEGRKVFKGILRVDHASLGSYGIFVMEIYGIWIEDGVKIMKMFCVHISNIFWVVAFDLQHLKNFHLLPRPLKRVQPPKSIIHIFPLINLMH